MVAATLIEATTFNSFTADVGTGLSTAICKDGQTVITANIPMATYRLTGLGAGSAAGHSLRYEQLFTTGAVTLLGAVDQVKGADIASAATVNLTTATGNAVHITGTTTITAVTLGSGMWRIVIFDGALTLTHSATANNLPGAANITTAAGDRALYWSDGTTVYCIVYQVATSIPSKNLQGTFTATLTGCTTSPTVTASYSVNNGVVTVFYPTVTATSNTTTFTLTGAPAAIRPTTAHSGFIPIVTDNGTAVAGACSVGTDGVPTFYANVGGGAFTTSGTKGLSSGITLTYNLT